MQTHTGTHATKRALFLIFASASLFLPFVSPAIALLAGIALALTSGNPFAPTTQKLIPLLLGTSITALGAGTDIRVVAAAGTQGVVYTAIGITLTMAVGLALGRALGLTRDLALLLSVGTAICGGSAIAAAASALRAKAADTSIALATVFVLNAAALLIFPSIGHRLDLSEQAFGLWSALAVHDTSSVVGASSQYGPIAAEIATTVKLVRALWIIPLTLVIGTVWAGERDWQAPFARLKRMWFIVGFVAMAALVAWIPELRIPGAGLAYAARRLLTLTLFLIGSGLNRATLREVGPRPLVHGVLLWLLAGSASLGAIFAGWI